MYIGVEIYLVLVHSNSFQCTYCLIIFCSEIEKYGSENNQDNNTIPCTGRQENQINIECGSLQSR